MLELHLLGRFEVAAGRLRSSNEVSARPKAAALLAYLACVRRKGHVRRATLLPLFWPEADEAAARHALSQTLYRLRQVLGPVVLTRGEEELRLDPDTVILDVERFEVAVAEGRWDDALGLYLGDLMPGLAAPDASGFEDWLDRERQRLRLLAADAATAAALAAVARGDASEAERTALRALELDPAREEETRTVIEALLAVGERPRAARLYQALRTHLARVLEVAPAPATVALEAYVLDTRLAPTRQRSAAAEPSRADPSRADPSRAEPSRADPPAVAPRPAARDFRALAAGVIVLLIGVTYAVLASRSDVNAAEGDDAVPVVVMAPFAQDSSDAGFEYLADGLYGAVVGELSLAAAVHLLPRAAPGRSDPAGAASDRDPSGLAVGAIVEGRVSRRQDTIRVELQIRRAAAGSRSWSGEFARPAADVLLLQRDLARALARELGLGLTARGRARFSSPPVVDVAAHDAWLRGKAHQRHRRRDDLLACIREATRALALAPDFAEAHLLLAECENVRTFVDQVAPAASFGNAIAAAERAIALDSGLAGAHAALAYAVAHHRWDWQAAERAFERALELQPEQASTHGDLGWMLAWIGRTDEARQHAREAVRLAPADPQALLRLGMIEHLARRHGDALDWAQRALALDSTFMFTWDRLHFAYMGLGRSRDAVRAAERASALAGPGDLRRRGFLAHAYASDGRAADAQRILSELRARDRTVYVPPVSLAAALVGLGEVDAALLALERSVNERDGDAVLLATSPLWDPLRGDPRFTALLRGVGFPQGVAPAAASP